MTGKRNYSYLIDALQYLENQPARLLILIEHVFMFVTRGSSPECYSLFMNVVLRIVRCELGLITIHSNHFCIKMHGKLFICHSD